MYPTEIQPIAFRPILCQCFEICVKEKMVVLGKMIYGSRTYGEHPFPGIWYILAVGLSIRDLLEVVAVYSQTQLLWQHLIGCGKVQVDGLSSLGIVGVEERGSRRNFLTGIIVFSVP